MRFPKETRAAIQQAAPHPVTIPWPKGAGQPQVGRLYWVQSAEDLEAERKHREESPETCAEVLVGMHTRHYGEAPTTTKRRRRRHSRGPIAGSDRIYVIDTTILDAGWEAKVVRYEDPDPVNHLQMRVKVPAGPDPLDGTQQSAETEPEQILAPNDRQRRLEEEEALRIAHKSSIDRSARLKAERHLIDQRRKGKRSKLAEEAVQRAKKREAEVGSAG